VTKLDLQNSSKLEFAAARLNSAVARIEATLAIKNVSVSVENLDPKLANDLAAELIFLRSENVRLRIAIKSISGRLDGAIRRLKDFIEDV